MENLSQYLKSQANKVTKRKTRGLHLYATDGSHNSGDFFLGPSTKWRFENLTQEEVAWVKRNVRNYFGPSEASRLNADFDYLLVGGGGLMLPDTNKNNTSHWQWPVENEALRSISVPIYVIGIGYNLFHGQRPAGSKDDSCPKYKKLKASFETLIDVSEYFSMRHRGDCERLKEIVDVKYHDKIKFEFCPTIEYCKNYVNTHDFPPIDRDIYAFEIKDDRPSMRYHNTSREKFYESLKELILKLLSLNKKVCVLSHDGSGTFAKYLRSNNVNVGAMKNTIANVEGIISNYLKIKKLFCTAGHSQMMGKALGCDIISLITHDKLKYFLQDIGEYTEDRYIDVNHDDVYEKLMRHATEE